MSYADIYDVKNPSFLERNPRLMEKYGHLVDGIKHPSGDAHETELEQNKLAILIDNTVREGCRRYGLNYATFDLNKVTEATTAASGQTAVGGTGPIGGVSTPVGIAGAGTDPVGNAFIVKNTVAMVTQMFPNMIARNIVSVQPIPQPSYKIFYMDILRSNAYTSAGDYDGTNTASVNAGQKANEGIVGARNYSDSYEYVGYDASTGKEDPDIKELRMELSNVDVFTEEKKLKVNVTMEVQQDLMAYHGMNAMSIMGGELSKEIAREWDSKIIAGMYYAAGLNEDVLKSRLESKKAGSTVTVSRTPIIEQFDMDYRGNEYSANTASWADREAYLNTFYEVFEDVATEIYKRRFVRPNFMVIPVKLGALFRKMKAFDTTPMGMETGRIVTGRYFAGTFKGICDVYVDVNAKDVLVGYNGDSWMNTGFVFSPYELAYMSPVVINPNTFRQTQAMLSRAALQCIAPDCYGIIKLLNEPNS